MPVRPYGRNVIPTAVLPGGGVPQVIKLVTNGHQELPEAGRSVAPTPVRSPSKSGGPAVGRQLTQVPLHRPDWCGLVLGRSAERASLTLASACHGFGCAVEFVDPPWPSVRRRGTDVHPIGVPRKHWKPVMQVE